MRRLRGLLALFALVGLAALALRIVFALVDRRPAGRPIVIGSKAFTEGILLGEIMAQRLEAAGVRVERRFNLGGTNICFEALRAGAIDAYAEYTGTALLAILHRPAESDPAAVLAKVREAFARTLGLVWLAPFGFNNAYALAMPRALAARLGIRRISDLVRHPRLRAGFASEFLAREDGWPGLERRYGLRFAGGPRSMEAGLMYQAAAAGQIDVISAYTTDGRIVTADLVLLEDDRRFFPPYQAAPLIRRDALTSDARVEPAFAPLGGSLDDETMRRLNLEIDSGRRTPAEVARAFLAARAGATPRDAAPPPPAAPAPER